MRLRVKASIKSRSERRDRVWDMTRKFDQAVELPDLQLVAAVALFDFGGDGRLMMTRLAPADSFCKC